MTSRSPGIAFPPGVTAEAVEQQLDRILNSGIFAQSESLRRLLRYVVEQTIQGRADQLKEYTLAVDVFERGESFDHRNDAIVRVQAGRLRSKIERFYKTEGRSDAVVIELPKGSYVPIFRTGVPLTSGQIGFRRNLFWPAAISLLVGMGVLSIWAPWRRTPGRAMIQPPSAASVAVLPFTNLSPEPDQNYFCDGIAEEISNALSQVPGLRVAARASAFEFKDKNADVREIARRLNVGTVLEGSVRTSHDRLRITAELVNAGDGFRLWSQIYERPMQDAFAVQDEIARAIVTAMKAHLPLAAKAPSHHTPDPEAYKLYLKGRYSAADNNAWAGKAINYFSQATQRDPSFAAAWAGLALAHISLAESKEVLPREASQRARAAAERALQLDDQLSEAHEAMAFAKWVGDWDWEGAAAEFRRSIEIRPDSENARVGYALWLCYAGRNQAAREQLEELQSAAALTTRAAGVQASIAYYGRDFDEAIHITQTTLSANPQARGVRYWLARSYAAQGKTREAIEQFNLVSNGHSAQGFGMHAYVYARAGRRAEALELLGGAEQRSRSRYVSPVSLAIAYTGVGDAVQAIHSLEKAYDDRDVGVLSVKVDTIFDPLRKDSKFQALLNKLHFPQN